MGALLHPVVKPSSAMSKIRRMAATYRGYSRFPSPLSDRGAATILDRTDFFENAMKSGLKRVRLPK